MARFVDVGRKVVNLERVDYFDEADEGATIVFSGDNRLPISVADWARLRPTLFVAQAEGAGEFSNHTIESPHPPSAGSVRRTQ